MPDRETRTRIRRSDDEAAQREEEDGLIRSSDGHEAPEEPPLPGRSDGAGGEMKEGGGSTDGTAELGGSVPEPEGEPTADLDDLYLDSDDRTDPEQALDDQLDAVETIRGGGPDATGGMRDDLLDQALDTGDPFEDVGNPGQNADLGRDSIDDKFQDLLGNDSMASRPSMEGVNSDDAPKPWEWKDEEVQQKNPGGDPNKNWEMKNGEVQFKGETPSLPQLTEKELDKLIDAMEDAKWSTPAGQTAEIEYKGYVYKVKGQAAKPPDFDSDPSDPDEVPDEVRQQWADDLEKATHYREIRMEAIKNSEVRPADEGGVDPGRGGSGRDPNSPDFGAGDQPVPISGGHAPIPSDGAIDPNEADDLFTRSGPSTSVVDEHGGHIGETGYQGGGDESSGVRYDELLPEGVAPLDPDDGDAPRSPSESVREMVGESVGRLSGKDGRSERPAKEATDETGDEFGAGADDGFTTGTGSDDGSELVAGGPDGDGTTESEYDFVSSDGDGSGDGDELVFGDGSDDGSEADWSRDNGSVESELRIIGTDDADGSADDTTDDGTGSGPTAPLADFDPDFDLARGHLAPEPVTAPHDAYEPVDDGDATDDALDDLAD